MGRLQAAISRDGFGGRDRPLAARHPVLAPSAHGRGDRHARDRARDSRAGAGGARLPARGESGAALRPDARRQAVRARAAGRSRPVDPASPDPAMARRRAADGVRKGEPAGARRDRGRPVRRLVAARSCATASSTAIRISAITPSRRQARAKRARSRAINLFDYGCVRIFPSRFVSGVVELYRALKANDEAHIAEAYAMWGFPKLTPRHVRGDEHLGALHLRAHPRRPRAHRRRRREPVGIRAARDRRRSCGRCGRKAAGLVIPREFVFLERATIGLGGAFLRLGARLNFHRLYEDAIAGFRHGRGREAAGRGAEGGGVERLGVQV